MSLPNSSRILVRRGNSAYFSRFITFDKAHKDARDAHETKNTDRARRAKNYQIGGIKDKNLSGWLQSPCKDSEGDAAVRDGVDSIEVMVVQKRDSQLFFLPWVRNSENIPAHTPNDDQAKAIAGCAVRLPYIFSYRANTIIPSLEDDMISMGIEHSWYKSYWLRGALILILDENFEAMVDEYRIHYCEQTGLKVLDE